MRGYDLHLVLHLDGSDDTYFIELYKQPLFRKVISALYHFYDMRVYKLPGFKLIEKLHRWIFKHQGEEYEPLVCVQDERCYYLVNKGRMTVTRFEVTKEQYEAWK